MEMYACFDSKKEVIDILESYGFESHSKGYSATGNYYLNHGEYDRPDYIPVRYKDGWGIKIVYYYYAGTLHAPKDHRLTAREWYEQVLLSQSA